MQLEWARGSEEDDSDEAEVEGSKLRAAARAAWSAAGEGSEAADAVRLLLSSHSGKHILFL